ncbi:hypothetical protein FFY45_18665 [Xanthomonas hortorum]|nr:hypothetical protein [Xanthomonas hortorum]
MLDALLKAINTDHLDWSLPVHRRGTLSGMDAAQELTRMYLQRVPRWWAGKALQQTRSIEGAVPSPRQRVRR